MVCEKNVGSKRATIRVEYRTCTKSGQAWRQVV